MNADTTPIPLNPEMVIIEATQHLRPNGTQRQVFAELEREYFPLYREMMAAGCRFEVEIVDIPGQIVAIDISTSDDVLMMLITPNGPEVHEAMIILLEARPWKQLITS
jgi:hypothetical protein